METAQNLIPVLRFPEFLEEWKKEKLGNTLSQIMGGGTPSREVLSYYENGKIPWVTVKDLSDDNYKNSTTEYITEEGLKKSAAKLIPANKFIISTRMGLGRGFVNKVPMSINQDMKALFPIEDLLDTVFLMYWYKKSSGNIESLGVGSTVKGIDLGTLKSLMITYPKTDEQQKIASFLMAVDDKTQQLKRKKELLEQYKKGVMQQLFSQQLRFTDDNGNYYPDWEEKTLEQIGEFKNGLNKSKTDFGFGYPFINLMDVFGKTSIVNGSFGLVNASQTELKSYNLKKGDVLFIRSSVKRDGVGEASVVLEDLVDTVYSGFLIRFREKEGEKIDLNFKRYCFSTKKFRNDLLSLSTTSANTNINQESLNLINISFPKIEEQQKIAHLLSSIDQKINHVQMAIEQTQRFKKGLLQQMFI